jgi:hypothetical protein
MAYKFRFDVSEFPKAFFEDLAKVSGRRGIHKKIGDFANCLVKKFRIQEIIGLPLSEAILLVEDMIDVHIKNTVQKGIFKGLGGARALFLPHCSRKYMDSRCKAGFDPNISSYKCNRCSEDCLVNKATELGRKKGYEIFVLPGGSCVKKITDKKKFSGVVGVACFEEIKLAGEFLKDLKIPAQAVPLVKNGCANTVFSMESLERVL